MTLKPTITAASGHAASPLIAIVGRPNVGKSTLFNRIIGSRKAVVSSLRGTTRDRVYGQTEWRGVSLRLVDTGGFELESRGPLEQSIQRHVQRAVEEADSIVVVCNAQEGLVPVDEMMIERLRLAGKPVILAVNKADQRPLVPPEFFSLGIRTNLAISALHGRGIGELLDHLVDGVTPTKPAQGSIERPPAIAIVGRQNVGKSSLFNALLREERVIVSDLPGTTRDAIDTHLSVEGASVLLIDTAGLRHRRKVKTPVDFFSMARSVEAIGRCDVAFVVLDATQGVTHDDQRIVTQVCEAGRGLILLVNKWDLVKGGNERLLPGFIYRHLPFAPFAPVISMSAKTGFHVRQSLTLALKVFRAMRRGMASEELVTLLGRVWMAGRVPRDRGRPVHLRNATWLPGYPPRIELITSPSGRLPLPFQRILLKALYAHPKLSGIPVRLVIANQQPASPRR